MNQDNQSFAAFIGLDKSDKKINVSLQRYGAARIERSIIQGSAQALHAWVAALCARFPHQRVAICVEQPAAGLIHALMGYDFVVLFPINPVTLARYRQAFTPSRAKDDPTDSQLLLDFLTKHSDQLRPWIPDSEPTRKLQALCEQRRKLVNRRVALTNRITSLLKQYFPQALGWIGDVGSIQACDFLESWSTLDAVQRVGPDNVVSRCTVRPVLHFSRKTK